MRLKFALLAFAAAAAAGCQHTPQDLPDRGVSAVNVPTLTRTDYVFHAAAPGGMLPPSEAARLDAWFRSLQISYGDAIYVEGPDAYAVRAEVARVAGNYGLLVHEGAPVTAGAVAPGTVRVMVSRNRAHVAGCPNWSVPAQPNWNNRTMSNFGCAVNSNLAAMVADPVDLIHGRAGTVVSDTLTADKAIDAYRKAEPTGAKGLQDINTKKEDE